MHSRAAEPGSLCERLRGLFPRRLKKGGAIGETLLPEAPGRLPEVKFRLGAEYQTDGRDLHRLRDETLLRLRHRGLFPRRLYERGAIGETLLPKARWAHEEVKFRLCAKHEEDGRIFSFAYRRHT